MGFKGALTMVLSRGEPDCSPNPSDPEVEANLPVHQPKFTTPGFEKSGVRMTWIGHATVLFLIDGVRVLADPIFSNRCSMSSYFGPHRYRPPPCKVTSLPVIFST